jgi:hypothetical protein
MTTKNSKIIRENHPVTKDGPFPREIVQNDIRISAPELCSGEYSATVVAIPDGGEEVFVEAEGVHSTGGYEVFFQKSPLDVYPPQFSLWHLKPSGPSTDVLTPFTEITTFQKTGEVREVIVVDKAGRHPVKVQRIGEKSACE